MNFGTDRLNLVGPLGPDCKTDLESYGVGDSEKRVCGLKTLIKHKKGEPFVVYSIGCHDEWSFEEEIFKHTNCTVEVFDCTVAHSVKPPEHIRSRVRLDIIIIIIIIIIILMVYFPQSYLLFF